MKHILAVDDEADIRELVTYNLRKEGFSVETASDGEAALSLVRKHKYDLLILDLMLPGIQGMELCRIIRSDSKTPGVPIIMLTAKGEEVDKILGLEMGADDYITKPFSPRELVARVKAILRRSVEKSEPEKILRIGNIEIDKARYIVSISGNRIKLSATEFRLFVYLAERKGRVFSRDQLLDAVWRDEAFVEPRTVDVHIRRLRSMIEENPATPVYIKTLRGIGYFFEAKE